MEREAREEAGRAQAAKALAFVGGITDEHGLPAAYAVALELTQRHLGGRPVKLVDLLLEVGLATTAEAAARVGEAQVGQDLAAELHALKWTRKRRAGRYWWARRHTRVWKAPPTCVLLGEGRGGEWTARRGVKREHG